MKDHVDCMKEGQNDISYITGAVGSSFLFLENLLQKSLEVPSLVDLVDEYAAQQLKEFD